MSLSFLYQASCRLLAILRRLRGERSELAIEIAMLRHGVAVLRRQIARPALQPADRAILLDGFLPFTRCLLTWRSEWTF